MKIVYAVDPLIHKHSKKIEEFNEDLVNLSKKMFKKMYEQEGIGLAGIQVGIPERIFVINIPEPKDEENKNKKKPNENEYKTYGKFCMINPEILWSSKEKDVKEEGCLSCPGFRCPVERSLSVEVVYFDEKGKKQKIKATDLLGRCIQHELDHLNGILFIDYLSRLKKDMATRKIKKYLKEQNEKI
ncbi:peptide deformylase [Pseudomonadota bacterium]